MKSTKRYLPILAIGLGFFFTQTLAADNGSASFDSMLNAPTLPCINNQPISTTGPTTVDIHNNSTSDGTHVVVHLQIHTDGQDDAGNPYQVSLEGTAQFDATASSYDVPFHSQWVGQGSAVNFRLTGVITVSIHDDGTISTAATQVDLPTCGN